MPMPFITALWHPLFFYVNTLFLVLCLLKDKKSDALMYSINLLMYLVCVFVVFANQFEGGFPVLDILFFQYMDGLWGISFCLCLYSLEFQLVYGCILSGAEFVVMMIQA